MTGETEVKLKRDRKGIAVKNSRFWSKWRRNDDAPRSLQHVLKQVENGAQVRGRGRDRVLAELQLHRDTTPDADLRSALTWLCNAQSRLVNDPSAARSREVLLAAYEVRRILAVS